MSFLLATVARRHFEWQKTHVDEWQKFCVMAESEHPYSAYYQQLDAVAKARTERN